jgi:N-acetylneuraminic acid mutarotase
MAYVIGGDSTFGTLLKDMWAYNPVTNTWTRKADFPGGLRDGMFSWVIGTKAYVGGGFDGQYILNDLYSYDPATDTWTQLNTMPHYILFPSTFVLNGKGYATLWEGGGFFNNLLQYDPATDTWTEKAACPATARGEGVGFAINGLGYAGLGQTNFTSSYTDFYVYNPVSDSWSKSDSFPIVNTGWSTSFVIGDNAYVGTGTDLPGFNYTNKFYKHTFTASAGVPALPANDLQVDLYPNPATGMITVQATGRLNKLEVYTLYGQRIIQQSGSGSGSGRLDISMLDRGIYFVYVYADERTGIRKLIVD